MMTENIEKTLKIKIGEEYKAKVETVGEFKDSMFKDVYEKAFDCIGSILADSSKEDSYEKYNNIVSFVGERGTGKTSAMLSVSGALKNEYPTEFKKEIFKGLKSDDKPKYTFNEIGIIDPSHFNENSNILEIILAKMFKKFKNKVEEKNNNNVDHDDKRKLIKAFEEVFENLKTIQNPKGIYDGESLDALLKMSASTDLKENMTNLVKKYLKFFNKSDDGSDKQNGILLLEIDDIDLSTKHAYEMVEQIRKYLIIPKVVILMAVKMQQLSHIVERDTRKEFEDLLIKSHMNDEEPKNMAEKYLEKLIPLDRRLFLPTLEGINLDMELIIQDKDNKQYQIGKDDNKEIKNIIRYLIFKRTGNMFFNTDTQVSYIIPRTLRELINLVSKLITMENNDTKIEDKITLGDLKSKQKDKNYESFKEYFLNYWVESTLKSNHTEVIREVIKRDIKERNKYIVRALNQEYSEKFEEIKTIDPKRTEKTLEIEYSTIIDFANKPTNISLGDLLLVLDLINRLIVDAEDKKFIFAIKTTYSIMLYGLIRDIKGLNKYIFRKIEEENKEPNRVKIEEASNIIREDSSGESEDDIKEKISKKSEEIKKESFDQTLKRLEEEESREIKNRKNKIDEYRSLLGQSLYNSIQYKNLKEFSWEYNNKEKAIIDHSIDYKKIADVGGDQRTEFHRLTRILTTVSGYNQSKKREYSINFSNSGIVKDIYKFDMLGFFYNFLDRKSLKCYLGNIELIEKLLILNTKINGSEKKKFFQNLINFGSKYQKIIRDEFLDGDYKITSDTVMKEIQVFCNKYVKETGSIEEKEYNKYFDGLKKYEREKIMTIKEIEKTVDNMIKGNENLVSESTLKKDLTDFSKQTGMKMFEDTIKNIRSEIKTMAKTDDKYSRADLRQKLKLKIKEKIESSENEED